MADVLAGLSLIEGFSRLLPALLVLLATYAILQSYKILGGKAAIDALVAVVVAALVLLSSHAVTIISYATPWLVVLFFVLAAGIVGFKSMGFSDAQILSGLKTRAVAVPWIVGFLVIVIGMLAIGQANGQALLEEHSDVAQKQANGELSESQSVALANGQTYATGNGGEPSLNSRSVATGSFSNNVGNTIFNPTVLSFILLGLIGAFTVLFMTGSAK